MAAIGELMLTIVGMLGSGLTYKLLFINDINRLNPYVYLTCNT